MTVTTNGDERTSRTRVLAEDGFGSRGFTARMGLVVAVMLVSGVAQAAAPRKPAPAPAPAAPAPETKPPPVDDVEPPVDVPVMAPFTGPASNRPLPPPAPIPGPSLEPDALGLEGSIEESLRQFQAEAVVSSATKREQRLKDVPMSVSWIPAEELEGTGQFTLCDTIQYFPGLECRRGAMRKATVSVHGLGSNFLSNRLLLLKNGRPETDPWTGIFYPDESTPLTNVKQIEVIKGPGSSLYGSNAFSGVINVISRTPDDLMKEGRNYGMDFRFLGGQNQTYRLQATAAGGAGPVKAMANYYGFKSDGAPVLSNPQTGVVDTNEWSDVHQVSTRVVVANGITIDAEYTNAAIGRPGGQAISDVGNCGRCHYTPNDSEHLETASASIQADFKVNDWLRLFGESYAYFKRREVRLENQITGELQPSLGKRRRLGGEVRALASLGSLSLTLGGDAKGDTVNNQNLLPEFAGQLAEEMIFGAFVDGEFRVLPNLAIGGGARYDYYAIPEALWRNRSSQISPRASIVFHATPQLTLRTNYGRAFRAPSLAELAINQQMYASTLEGNPYLKAETLDTIEAAVDIWPAGGAVRLTGTGFYKYASNFINQEFAFGSTSRFQNIGDARIWGAEAEAAAKVPQINSAFDLAYQFLNTQTLPLGGGTGGPLDYAPSHRVYFRAHTNLGQHAFFDLYALYVGARLDPARVTNTNSAENTGSGSQGPQAARIQLPGYLVANARVGANVIPGLSVSLLAQNLFNNQYQEMHGFPAAGLRLFSEVKFVY